MNRQSGSYPACQSLAAPFIEAEPLLRAPTQQDGSELSHSCSELRLEMYAFTSPAGCTLTPSGRGITQGAQRRRDSADRSDTILGSP
ncbi:hypothetical protein FKM82_028727 [Ascaphus truei]